MKYILPILLFFINLTIHAQQIQLEEKVYLKNGSIIRGNVIEQIPNKTLKIQTADGSIFVYEMEQVEKITKEPIEAKQNIFKSDQSHQQSNKDYLENKIGRPMGMVQFFGVGYQDMSDYVTIKTAYFNYNFVYGYQFINHIFVGGGVGMEHMVGDIVNKVYNLRIPIFGTLKFNFTDTQVSPFIRCDLGHYFNTYDYLGNGFFFHPTIGLDFNLGRAKRKALFLSFSIAEYGGNIIISGYSYNGISRRGYNNNKFHLKSGMNFGLRF